MSASAWLEATVDALKPLAGTADADAMARYMKGVAPFLGITTPQRRAALRTAWRPLDPLAAEEVAVAARALWALPEREYQYAACELIGRHVRSLPATFLGDPLEYLITTKAWWDTVDLLETNAIVPLVTGYPELVAVMWTWLGSDDRWLVRSAIQHQRGRKADTDFARLYAMCDHVATEREFFIAKAVGWALREACRWDRAGVADFVTSHPSLSAVARREATRGLAASR